MKKLIYGLILAVGILSISFGVHTEISWLVFLGGILTAIFASGVIK